MSHIIFDILFHPILNLLLEFSVIHQNLLNCNEQAIQACDLPVTRQKQLSQDIDLPRWAGVVHPVPEIFARFPTRIFSLANGRQVFTGGYTGNDEMQLLWRHTLAASIKESFADVVNKFAIFSPRMFCFHWNGVVNVDELRLRHAHGHNNINNINNIIECGCESSFSLIKIFQWIWKLLRFIEYTFEKLCEMHNV
jgi:hypothetical protein